MTNTHNNWRQATRADAVLNVITSTLFFIFLVCLCFALNPTYASDPVPPKDRVDWRSLDPRTSEEVHEEMAERKKAGEALAYSESRLNARMQALYSDMRPPKDTALVMEKAARLYSVDPQLLLSLCVVESSLRPHAQSSVGATGLCQIVPKWHNVTKKDMLDYRKNVNKSAEHLAELIGKCRGNLKCALHSYNVGYSGYRNGARASLYVSRVLAEYRRTI